MLEAVIVSSAAHLRLCGPIGLGSVLVLALTACTAPQSYIPAPLDARQIFASYTSHDLDDPALREFLAEHGHAVADWPQERWDLTSLTLAALFFNPEFQVAKARWRLQKTDETIAGQRINPTFNLPLGWYVELAEEDRSPLLLGAVLELVLERPGKRQARIDQAVLKTAAARIDIGRVAWDIRSRVYAALTDYVTARQTRNALEQRQAVIEDIHTVLRRRKELGQVGAFELSTTRLELQRIRLELSEQQRLIDEARVRLAAAIGIDPADLEGRGLLSPDPDGLPPAAELPVPDVRGLALLNRHDVRRVLTEYAAQEAALRLEIEKQYPDINLSPGFVFDQSDYLWQLGAAWVLPLLHRNEGQIAAAMQRRALLREQFMSLQAAIVNDVHQARSTYLGHLRTYQEAQALQAEAHDYQKQIGEQLEAGYADRLEYLRARQALTEAGQAAVTSRTALLQAFAALEQALQYPLLGEDWPNIAAGLVNAGAAETEENNQ